ncbi:hypothetical protein BDQ17DRAFT_1357475 [Cyathus striatus]|nr:hypothetical protein BDQ17DRAFT_1357475 [Cyathus striatus]
MKMGGGPSPTKSTKTVVVLGVSYGGARAAQILAAGIPKGWRVILVDRNSHANHVYVMPRFAVLPGHEFKAVLIPYTNVFLLNSTEHPHICLKAHVTSIRPTHITLSQSFPEHGVDSPDKSDFSLNEKEAEGTYEYTGTKSEAWIKASESVLVVGGGALFATDIKAIHPTKHVTLLHSRERLLPRFDERMHAEVLKYTSSVEIDLILGERLDLSSLENGQARLLCTGQTPNTALLRSMDPPYRSNNLVKVLRTLQGRVKTMNLESAPDVARRNPYPHIFAIGDAADAFGAIAAGHCAYNQGEVAARNLIRLIKNAEKKDGEEKEVLEMYTPGPPGIKVSLGLAPAIWPYYGMKVEKEEDMYP